MTLTDEQIKGLATQLGFISGANAGYSQPGLWTKDSTGGGHVDIYPFRNGWTVAFFGPGANIPHSGRFFPEAKQAFRYATH
jgi:hypothetical protein